MGLVNNLENIFKKGVIGNVRTAQEDSWDWALKTPNGDVFVVCDGMGGHVGGAKASGIAVKNIIEYLQENKYDDPLSALDGALRRANDQILGEADNNPELKGMGTTACILLLQSDGAYLAHVGDSRIYLYHGEERTLNRITKDHSYVQTLVDSGAITDEQAETHPHKNRILKALGVVPSSNLVPSFNSGHPKVGDTFLICSDGLSGMIPDRTIENVLQQDSSVEAKGEMLINLAMEGETVRPGGQDNCTVELIQVDHDPWPKGHERSFQYYNPAKTTKISVKRNGGKTVAKVFLIIAIAFTVMVALGVAGVFAYKWMGNYKQQNGKEISVDKDVAGINKLEKEIATIKQEIADAEKEIASAQSKLDQNQSGDVKTKASNKIENNNKLKEMKQQELKQKQAELERLQQGDDKSNKKSITNIIFNESSNNRKK